MIAGLVHVAPSGEGGTRDDSSFDSEERTTYMQIIETRMSDDPNYATEVAGLIEANAGVLTNDQVIGLAAFALHEAASRR